MLLTFLKIDLGHLLELGLEQAHVILFERSVDHNNGAYCCGCMLPSRDFSRDRSRAIFGGHRHKPPSHSLCQGAHVRRGGGANLTDIAVMGVNACSSTGEFGVTQASQ